LKRQLDPGETLTLEVVFTTGDPDQGSFEDFPIGLTFEEQCAVNTFDLLVYNFSLTIDFDDFLGGEYVDMAHYQNETYGIEIKCKAGLSDECRILDTESPMEENLGSTNEDCPDPGPGVGEGGEPGSPYENCEPQYRVLIMQHKNSKDPITEPNSHEPGGDIEINFSEWQGTLNELGVLVGDNSTVTLRVRFLLNLLDTT